MNAPTAKPSAHTPSPWRILQGQDKDNVPRIASKDGGIAILCVNRYMGDAGPSPVEQANARRIVACVNACEGRSTSELEIGTLSRHETLDPQAAAWGRERAALRAQLADCTTFIRQACEQKILDRAECKPLLKQWEAPLAKVQP